MLKSVLDRGLPLEGQIELQTNFAAMKAGTQKGLSEFLDLKTVMDGQLLSGNLDGWSRAVIRFNGDLCVASTGVVATNRDLEGNWLQALHDLDTPMQSVMCGIVATASGGAVVFVWPTSFRIPRKFLDSILKQGTRRLPTFLVQFLFAYIENTVFSSKWWESLSEFNCQQLTALAAIGNAYDTDFQYLAIRAVPWEITGIEINDPA